MVSLDDKSGVRIMIVEDERLVAEDLTLRLKGMGYADCRLTAYGEGALEMIEAEPPDIVLMDIVLKGAMDGIEAAEAIRNRWGIPVVFLTAHADQQRIDRAKSTYPFGYILKPFQDRELNVVIQMAIYAARAEADRRRTAEELRRSEERFRTFFNTSQAGFLIWDAGAPVRFQAVNESLAAMNGRPAAEHIGRTIAEVFDDPNVARDHEEFLRQLIRSKTVATLESSGQCQDGRQVDYIAQYFPLLDREGAVEAIGGIVLDITQRRRAEEALKESENRLRAVVESLNEGVIFQDAAGEILTWNHSAETIFGIRAGEALGLTSVDYDWRLVNEDGTDCPGEMHPSMITLRTGRALQGEIRGIRHPDGSYTWLSVNTRPVFKPGQDEPYAVTISFSDITAWKKAEQVRDELEVQLRQAQKMEAVGTLAGGVAHDFNNLLQAINGYTQLLLLNKKAGDPGHLELREILKAGQRASDLVRQLLAFSRKAGIDRRPLDLNDLVRQVEKLFKRTIPKMIQVDLQLADDLRTVEADPVQIEQVLLNLGSNAADAMPDGGRLVIETGNVVLDEDYCRCHLGASPGDYVCLKVTDSGMGMDKEMLDHIFEPFFTTKEVGKGTGMGLASVYGIVKTHGGYIMCYSEPGQGAVFRVYLPAVDQMVDDDSESEEPRLPGGTERILLVDDEEPIRKFAVQVLERFGYTLLTASSGEDALQVYRAIKDSIDLVILDLGMPGMGGHKCLAELLRQDPSARVLIASGYSMEGHAKKALESGAAGYIGKPYQVMDLLTQVRAVLDEEE
ncbi:MAG: response regulator [Proteobacteria bacterium]|nr:response regulator [Pseudomonadota bacterium]